MINVGINLRLPLLLPIRDLDMLDDDDDNGGNNGVTGHWVVLSLVQAGVSADHEQ